MTAATTTSDAQLTRTLTAIAAQTQLLALNTARFDIRPGITESAAAQRSSTED